MTLFCPDNAKPILRRYCLLLWLIVLTGSASAQSERASEGSTLSLYGASTVVEGSVELLAAGPVLLVEAVQQTGQGALVVLNASGRASGATLTLSLRAGGAASLAVGQTVTVTASAAGYLLSSAGRMVAWLPNALGQRLVYDEILP